MTPRQIALVSALSTIYKERIHFEPNKLEPGFSYVCSVAHLDLFLGYNGCHYFRGKAYERMCVVGNTAVIAALEAYAQAPEELLAMPLEYEL